MRVWCLYFLVNHCEKINNTCVFILLWKLHKAIVHIAHIIIAYNSIMPTILLTKYRIIDTIRRYFYHTFSCIIIHPKTWNPHYKRILLKRTLFFIHFFSIDKKHCLLTKWPKLKEFSFLFLVIFHKKNAFFGDMWHSAHVFITYPKTLDISGLYILYSPKSACDAWCMVLPWTWSTEPWKLNSQCNPTHSL